MLRVHASRVVVASNSISIRSPFFHERPGEGIDQAIDKLAETFLGGSRRTGKLVAVTPATESVVKRLCRKLQ